MKKFAFVLPLLVQPLFADVTVTRVTRSDGYRGMGAYEATSTERYKETSKREESKTKFKGAVMGRLAGGEQVTITRVADDKVIALDPKRKTYQESTITQAAEKMEEAREQMEKAEKGPGEEKRKD